MSDYLITKLVNYVIIETFSLNWNRKLVKQMQLVVCSNKNLLKLLPSIINNWTLIRPISNWSTQYKCEIFYYIQQAVRCIAQASCTICVNSEILQTTTYAKYISTYPQRQINSVLSATIYKCTHGKEAFF